MSAVSYFKKLVSESQAFKSVGIYTGITFFSKAVSFLLILIYTQPRFMTPEENGLLNLFGSSIIFLMPFLSMGILHSTSTEFFKLDKDKFRNFFTTNLILPLFVMGASLIVFFLFRNYLKISYGFPLIFIILIPVITFLTYTNEQLLLMLRNNNELRKYAITGIAKITLEFGLSVVLVVFFTMHWKGRLTGIIASYVILGVYAFYYFKQKGYLSGSFSRRYIKSELIYAIPVAAMQLSIFSLYSSDKFIIASLSKSNEVVGVYGIACTFATIIIIFSAAYLNYLFPVIYKGLSSTEGIDYQKIKKNFFRYLGVMAAVALLIIIATPVVYSYFINEQYHSAIGYFYLLVLGYFMWSLSFYFYSFLLYYKEKIKLLLLSFCIIALSIFCIYFFTKSFGVKGTAVGVLVSYASAFLLTLFFARKYIYMVFGIKRRNK